MNEYKLTKTKVFDKVFAKSKDFPLKDCLRLPLCHTFGSLGSSQNFTKWKKCQCAEAYFTWWTAHIKFIYSAFSHVGNDEVGSISISFHFPLLPSFPFWQRPWTDASGKSETKKRNKWRKLLEEEKTYVILFSSYLLIYFLLLS